MEITEVHYQARIQIFLREVTVDIYEIFKIL